MTDKIMQALRYERDTARRRARVRLSDWSEPALENEAIAELTPHYKDPERRLIQAALGVMGDPDSAMSWLPLVTLPACRAYLEDLAGKLSNSHQLRA